MWAPASLILLEGRRIGRSNSSDSWYEKFITRITKTWTKLSLTWTRLSTSQRMGAVATLTVAQDVTEPGVRTLTTPESQKVLDTMKHVEKDQSYSSFILHVWRTAWVWTLITGRFCWPRLLSSRDSTYQCRGVGTYMSEIERLQSIQTGITKVESTVCGMCVK